MNSHIETKAMTLYFQRPYKTPGKELIIINEHKKLGQTPENEFIIMIKHIETWSKAL